MTPQALLALIPLAVIVFVWLLNRSLTKRIRESEADARKAYEQTVNAAERVEKLQADHEKIFNEIHRGVSDDRASSLLSSGPND